MLNLVKNEWLKIFNRNGTFIMIALLAVSVVCVGAFTKIGETKYQQPPEITDWKDQANEEIKIYEQQLKELPSTATVQRNTAERLLEVNKYRLEKDIAPPKGNNGYAFIENSSPLIDLAALFTIIVAAGIIASEFSWGTIKLLLIRPIKRSKILLSKYITVVLFGLLMLGVIFITSTAVGFILFGSGEGNNVHLAYSGGEVVEQNMIFHLIKMYLLSSVNMIMLTTMAFMISAVFRNSSLAIGISIFLLLMGGNVTYIIATKYEWAKYLLFANTNLYNQYFDGIPLIEGMTLGFSVTMLIIYFIFFMSLAFSIFSKRDVAA
jgi:ABC-2 type transport system permease protein